MFERCLCQRVSLFLDVRMASEKNMPWKRSEVCSLHTREWGKHKNVCRPFAIPYVPHRNGVREARCAAQTRPCHVSKEAIHPQTTDTTSQNLKLLTVAGQVFWNSEVPVCTWSNSCERADAPVTPQWQPTFEELHPKHHALWQPTCSWNVHSSRIRFLSETEWTIRKCCGLKPRRLHRA